MFVLNQRIRCIHTGYLPDKSVKPPLEKDKEYTVNNIAYDKEGNQHLDVGLKSAYNWITSKETGEELPEGNKIHWCHPSRFEEVI
jgi:hypothetical protein